MTRSKLFPILTVLLLAGCREQTTGHETSVTSPEATFANSASPSGDTPVTTTIADADATIAPALQIRSDNLGAYRNSSTLTSIIQSVGALLLDSYNPRNSTRRVYLDFAQPVANSGPNGGDPVAIPSALYKVHMISKCNLYGNSMLTLAPGATMPCPLHVGSVFVGSDEYAVQMNPFTSADPNASYPETNFANITCTVPSSGVGPCTQWRITPSGTFRASDNTLQFRNVGKLLKYVTINRKVTAVNQGDFYFSFAIGVTAP